ncbi:MAG: hypothetical protein K9H48_07715 [Melioribacteraceae bacterium]|nr:hypothetical protein [Melioribacteraceae bacterium]
MSYKDFQRENTEVKLVFSIKGLKKELDLIKNPRVILLSTFFEKKLISIERRTEIIWKFFQNNRDFINTENQRRIEEMFLNVL